MILASVLAARLLLAAGTESFTPPSWSLNQPLYEVNLEMFSKEGNYQGLQKRLPELKKLGVGILWLMPIYERGVLNAFGSPYCVKNYKGLHKAFGSPEELKGLVKAAHAQGLHVIFDWVPNHTSWDNAWIKEHPEYYKKDKQGKISKAYDWGDVAQLDYGNAAMRRAMIEAMSYWVHDFDADGFRCDVAWGVPVDFWVRARTELSRIKPVFMLAESDNPEYQAAFDADYDWGLMNTAKKNRMCDIAQGLQPASVITQMIKREQRRYRPPFARLRFTTNHDEWKDNGTTSQRLGAGLRAFAVLTSTLPGKPLIYNGQEIGWQKQQGSIEWPARSEGNGDFEFFQRLFWAHQRNPALYAGQWRAVDSSNPDSVVAYLRRSGTARVLVALNLSKDPAECLIEDAPLAGPWTDLFTGKKTAWEGLQTLKMAPWEYKVLASSSNATDPGFSESACKGADAMAACNSGWTPIEKVAVGSKPNVSASFRTEYNSRTFSVYVNVSKTPLVHDSPNKAPWEDDGVEVFLDMKHDRNSPYAADDFQFIVGYKNPDLFEAQNRTQGVKSSCKEAPGGYQVKLEIPWLLLNYNPAAGTSFGFDVGVDVDLDGGTRDAALVWAGDDQNYRDTWQFGDLTLGQSCP